MNTYGWQLASWAARIEDRQPFYLAVIDGETRIGFVNSHFYLQFQQAGLPAEQGFLRYLVDERDRGRFEEALAACLGEEKEQMYRKVREAGIHGEQQERERIGRELHDNINQILTSAQLYLSCLTRDNPDFDMLRSKTGDILAMAIEEIRCLSHNIVPPDLQEQGLIESIERLIDEIRRTGRFDIDFSWSDLMTIETQDEGLKQTVYRIVQEQIHNICKYSQASRVRVILLARNEQLRLQITDNGIGFDAKTVREGLGLTGISRRAKLYKGKAIFNAAPGKGCSMVVTIPLALRQLF